MNPPYYLVEDGATTGPHTLTVLQQKAEIRVIGPETFVRAVVPEDAPWRRLKDEGELFAHLFPARASLTLSKANFTATNTQSDAGSRAVDVQTLLRDNAAYQVAAEKRLTERPLAKVGSARRRDFIVIAGGSCAFATVAWLITGRSPILGIFALSFATLMSLGTYWVLYHVQDPY